MMKSRGRNRGQALSDKMASGGLVRIMATHSPLSARLAEEAGFDGLWASGFELSALYGLADVSLISMTQHLEMSRTIAEQSDLPISIPASATPSTSFTPSSNISVPVPRPSSSKTRPFPK